MPIYLKNNKLYNSKILYQNIGINKNIIPNYINNFISNKLLNKTPSTDIQIYTTKDPYANGVGNFIRNPSCWLNGVTNISCFSPAQLSGANWWQRGGTLLTTKHIILAKHFGINILSGGTPLIFVDNNNNVIRRNLISYALDNTDIAIGLLDNDVPSNIKIAKVLPKNFNQYINTSNISSIYDGFNTGLNSFIINPSLYAVGLDQEEKALLKIWDGCNIAGVGSSPNTIWYHFVTSSNSNTSWNESILTGDSGKPLFIIIDNELVILTTWFTPSGGPFVTNRYDVVNSLIESLSPGEGYALTPINLDLVYQKYS